MHIVLATDADWIVDEVTSALGGPDVRFTVCRDGRAVTSVVREDTPELAILDLQIGSMGGVAVAMDLRLDESGGLLPTVPIMMLLDRTADIHMARRSGANGWLIKPVDALRLRRAAREISRGGCYAEGVVAAESLPGESVEPAPAG